MDWVFLLFLFSFWVFVWVPHQMVSTHPFALFVYIVLLWRYFKWIPKERKWFRFHPWIQKITMEYMNPIASDPHNTLNNKNQLFFYHPHGVYATCMFIFFCCNKKCQNVRVAVSSILFRIPIVKEVVGLLGCIPVNRQDIVYALGRGESVCVCPGGLRELLLHKDSPNSYYLRKSTVQLAIDCGVNVVLVECPDEVLLYSLWIPNLLYILQNALLKVVLYPFFIFSWGNRYVPFWPKQITPNPTLYFSKQHNPIGKTVDNFTNEIYQRGDDNEADKKEWPDL